MRFEIVRDKEKYEFENQLPIKAGAISPYEILKHVKIPMPNNFKLQNNGIKSNTTIKYYAKKHKKSPWTLIKIDLINI